MAFINSLMPAWAAISPGIMIVSSEEYPLPRGRGLLGRSNSVGAKHPSSVTGKTHHCRVPHHQGEKSITISSNFPRWVTEIIRQPASRPIWQFLWISERARAVADNAALGVKPLGILVTWDEFIISPCHQLNEFLLHACHEFAVLRKKGKVCLFKRVFLKVEQLNQAIKPT